MMRCFWIVAFSLTVALGACDRGEPAQPSHATAVGADTRRGNGSLLDSVTGTIARVAPGQLTVRDSSGRLTELALDGRVRVFDARRQVSTRVLLPEEQVRVSFATVGSRRVTHEVDILDVPASIQREAGRRSPAP
jgi:hypothetical protein